VAAAEELAGFKAAARAAAAQAVAAAEREAAAAAAAHAEALRAARTETTLAAARSEQERAVGLWRADGWPSLSPSTARTVVAHAYIACTCI
jgi:hypothetical protein